MADGLKISVQQRVPRSGANNDVLCIWRPGKPLVTCPVRACGLAQRCAIVRGDGSNRVATRGRRTMYDRNGMMLPIDGHRVNEPKILAEHTPVGCGERPPAQFKPTR